MENKILGNKILGAILLLIALSAGFYFGVNYISPRIGGMVHNVKEIFSEGLEITSTTIGIEATGPIRWEGTSEWMQIFLENLDTTPGSSGIVMSLINDASITNTTGNQDQITLELKDDIKSATDFAGDNLTTLRARVEFKGTSTYTSGNVQPINAVLGSDSGVTLTGSSLRAGNFRVRLGSDPGHAEILLLENDCVADESYLDTHINFHGGGSQTVMEFGPTQDTTSWNGTAEALTDEEGWLKIKVGGEVRYIQLYKTLP